MCDRDPIGMRIGLVVWTLTSEWWFWKTVQMENGKKFGWKGVEWKVGSNQATLSARTNLPACIAIATQLGGTESEASHD